MATITLYGTNVADSTLASACKMVTGTGGTEVGVTTTIPSTPTLQYAQVLSKGGTYSTVSSLLAPDGSGWIYWPGQAGTFDAGNWSAINTHSAFFHGTSLIIRFYKYSSGTYTAIGSITVAMSVSSKTVYNFPATAMPATTLSATDGLYIDLWWFDSGGAQSDSPVNYVSSSSSAGVANDMVVTTSNFTLTTPVLETDPPGLTFSAVQGGTNPASKNDTLLETAGVSTAWTSSISYGAGSGWLSISPTSGTLAANGSQSVSYTCATGSLIAGTYTATVTYTATTGGATATVGVTFTVNAPSNTSFITSMSTPFGGSLIGAL